jgi:hypothetical protein
MEHSARMAWPNHSLVPAKAGTQYFAKIWMPAFAGMSGILFPLQRIGP